MRGRQEQQGRSRDGVSNISTACDDDVDLERVGSDEKTNSRARDLMKNSNDDDDDDDQCNAFDETPERIDVNGYDSTHVNNEKRKREVNNTNTNNNTVVYGSGPVPSNKTPVNAFKQRDQRHLLEEERDYDDNDRESASPMFFGGANNAMVNEQNAYCDDFGERVSNGQDFLANAQRNNTTKKKEEEQKDDSAKASPDKDNEEMTTTTINITPEAENDDDDSNVEMKSPLAFLFKRRKENTPKYERGKYGHGAVWASIGSPGFPHKGRKGNNNSNNNNNNDNSNNENANEKNVNNNTTNNEANNNQNNSKNKVEFEDAQDSFGGSAGKATDFGVDEEVRNRNRAKMRMSLPANLAQSIASPLPISKRVLDRIECLGPELARVQKIMLLTGIFLDFWGKFSLFRELRRFSVTASWLWFSLVLIFFLISGCLTTSYWLLHYPMPEKPAKDDKEANATVFGYTKYDFKVFVRRFGACCAACQLGTAFAAWRALRSHDVRQRKAEMDLRGMQLVDCIFLSLPVATLQCYIGMMCSSPFSSCPDRSGFDYVLFSAVAGGLLSGTLCFVSLDLHEKPPAYSWREYWGVHKAHLSEMLAKFNFRFFELTARVVTIGLFAAVCGPWVFLVFFMHILFVLGLMRMNLPGVPDRKKVWAKLLELKDVALPFQTAKYIAKRGGKKKTIRIPVLDDVKLLTACLIWPPSCFVSNATDKKGRFWWRSTTCPRKSFWGLTREDALIPFVLILGLFAFENGVMLVVITHVSVDHWYRYLGLATFLNFIWLASAVVWISAAALWNPFTPNGPPLAYPSLNVAAPENYRVSSSSFKDNRKSSSGRRSGVKFARRSRAWVSPTASPVIEVEEVEIGAGVNGRNIGEKFNAAASADVINASIRYDEDDDDVAVTMKNKIDLEMGIVRSPDIIVDINNTSYRVEDSAGEEDEEDLESFETNEPSAFQTMIDRTGEHEMLRRSLQWQRASEEMLKSVTGVKMKAEADLAAARAAMNFLNRESVESKSKGEEADEESDTEDEEEELNRTMSSDAYIESMQRGRLTNEITGDAYVDAMRSPGGASIASDGQSPLGRVNANTSRQEGEVEREEEEEEDQENHEEEEDYNDDNDEQFTEDPWGFDENKLKINSPVNNIGRRSDDVYEYDDDNVNNESPTAFPSPRRNNESNSSSHQSALETPMFSPVNEQPAVPKFSPRLTRAQSRAARSTKYFK
jgi:hypothetical protein